MGQHNALSKRLVRKAGARAVYATAMFLLLVTQVTVVMADSSTSRRDSPRAVTTSLLPLDGLDVTGTVSLDGRTGSLRLTPDMIAALPRHKVATSTVVTDGVKQFEGVLMRDLLEHVNAKGDVVIASALNRYQAVIPTADFYNYDVLLAWMAQGRVMRATGKGPFWLIYPRDQHTALQDIRYDTRWVWQLRALHVQ